MCRLDKVSGLLANHDACGVGVAGDDCGHDRCVRYAEALDPMNLETWVHDSQPVVSHLASPHRMPGRRHVVPEVLVELFIRSDSRTRVDFCAAHLLIGFRVHDLARLAQAGNQCCPVSSSLKVIGSEERRGMCFRLA